MQRTNHHSDNGGGPGRRDRSGPHSRRRATEMNGRSPRTAGSTSLNPRRSGLRATPSRPRCHHPRHQQRRHLRLLRARRPSTRRSPASHANWPRRRRTASRCRMTPPSCSSEWPAIASCMRSCATTSTSTPCRSRPTRRSSASLGDGQRLRRCSGLVTAVPSTRPARSGLR